MRGVDSQMVWATTYPSKTLVLCYSCTEKRMSAQILHNIPAMSKK